MKQPKSYTWFRYPSKNTSGLIEAKLKAKYGLLGLGVMAEILSSLEGRYSGIIRITNYPGLKSTTIRSIITLLKDEGLIFSFEEISLWTYSITVSDILKFDNKEDTPEHIEDPFPEAPVIELPENKATSAPSSKKSYPWLDELLDRWKEHYTKMDDACKNTVRKEIRTLIENGMTEKKANDDFTTCFYFLERYNRDKWLGKTNPVYWIRDKLMGLSMEELITHFKIPKKNVGFPPLAPNQQEANEKIEKKHGLKSIEIGTPALFLPTEEAEKFLNQTNFNEGV